MSKNKEEVKVRLRNVRLRFHNIFKKGVFDGKENNKYDATFLVSKKDTAAFDHIKKSIEKMIKGTDLEDLEIGDFDCFIADGDADKKRLKKYPDFAGNWVIKASNSDSPTVKNADGETVYAEDNVLYNGCYVHLILSLWYQNNKFGQKVNANLLGVMFSKDGKPLGTSKVANDDDFEAFNDLDDDSVEDEY